MASLIEVASRVQSPRGRAVIADILSASKMFQALSIYNGFEIDTTVSNFRPFAVNNILQSRALGSSFTYTYASLPNAQSLTQAIVGAIVPIDRSYYRDASIGGNSIASWFEKQIKKAAVSFGKEIDEKLFAGTGTSNDVKGLSKILNGTTDIPGFTGFKGVVNAKDYSTDTSPTSLDIADPAKLESNGRALHELLLNTISQMESPTLIVMNNKLWARIYSIAGKLNLLGAPTNELFKTPTLLNLQPVIVSTTAIPDTEDDDATTPNPDTSSIYILSPAEMQFSLVTNGFDYLEATQLETMEAGEEKWEMGVAWKIENKDAVRRIRNIKV